jgi:hypothetical protein
MNEVRATECTSSRQGIFKTMTFGILQKVPFHKPEDMATRALPQAATCAFASINASYLALPDLADVDIKFLLFEPAASRLRS